VSSSYTVVEGVCGAVFALLALHFGPHAVLVPYLLLAAGLIALSVVDLQTFRLPNRIVGPLTLSVVVSFGVVAAITGDGGTFVRALEAGVAATAALGLLHLAYPPALGFGDVKLAFVLGVATGWASWGALGLAIFLAAAIGAAVGVIGAFVAGEPVRGRRLPFGPFLAAGALLAAVVGPSLLDWYARLLR
jgi:leader peptidase (prepilin peptidase)/N-methyltransferase